MSSLNFSAEIKKFRGGYGVDSWPGARPSARYVSNETVGKPPKRHHCRRAKPAQRGIGPGCWPTEVGGLAGLLRAAWRAHGRKWAPTAFEGGGRAGVSHLRPYAGHTALVPPGPAHGPCPCPCLYPCTVSCRSTACEPWQCSRGLSVSWHHPPLARSPASHWRPKPRWSLRCARTSGLRCHQQTCL
jgi:hypothetical protein